MQGSVKMQEKIEKLFEDNGYLSWETEWEETELFYKQEGHKVYGVLVVDAEHGLGLTEAAYQGIRQRIAEWMMQTISPQEYPMGREEILTLIIGGNMEWIQHLCASEEGIWAYRPENGRLVIYENQPGDFYGLRSGLESIPQKKAWELPLFTGIIAAINVIVFVVLECMGSTESATFIAEHGGMYPDFVLEEGEWWRILTAMFLHFGAAHLLNNMVIFCCVGSRLERAVGYIRFLVIYFLSGIGGGLLSLFMMVHTGDYAVSAGASGAIFGVIGGFLWAVIRHRGRLEGVTARGMMLMITLSLYYGFSTIGIDNWCHVGGIITGFVVSVILYHGKCQKD